MQLAGKLGARLTYCTVMFFVRGAILLCVAGLSCGAATMTNSWAVQVTSGGQQAADALATKYGFINLGQVGNLETVFHFVMPVENFPPETRQKKSITEFPEASHFTQQLKSESNVGYAKQQERRKLEKKEGYDFPTDPKWTDQWSLLNTGQLNLEDAGNDLNVERAWLQGVTGCGSVVAIVDDGVEYTHSDLRTNYVHSLQYDFLQRDTDPFPEIVDGEREDHGTNVAGEVGMGKGNDVCGIGVAYNSFITALRLISDPGPTDIDEAEALSWETNVIEVYSNSWGPADNGVVVAGPADVLKMALETNTREGRNGKGSIYVYAAGNGGLQDTCAADGYSNSIYTISVGSAASNGERSEFDEMCSAKMVVTFDSNPYENRRHVTTTTIDNACNDDFVGTSASTPLVSGVLALLLEANPDLTWRDVQYLLAYTSNTNNLVDGDWTTNGAGLLVSLKFGFGAIDAEAIVSRGRHWINVPAQLSQDFNPFLPSREVPQFEPVTETFTVFSDIVSLEHVVLTFSMHFDGISELDYETYLYEYIYEDYSGNWPQRGTVQVDLTSPSGTTSTLLPLRTGDIFPGSYDDWPLLSLHFWGENPAGTWTITIKHYGFRGTVFAEVPRVTFYGTSQVPEAVSRIPTECSSECDPTRGCAASGAEFCDACAELRVSSTLECTSSCPEGLTQRNGYCYDATLPESSCEAASPQPINTHPPTPAPAYSPLRPRPAQPTKHNSAAGIRGFKVVLVTMVIIPFVLF